MDYICWRRENVDTCKHIRSNFSAFLLFHVQSQTFYGGCKLAEHSFSYIRISIDEWRVWWLIVGAMLYFILYLIFKDICLLLYPWIFVLLCKIKTYEWKNISIFPSKGSWLLPGFQQRVISFIILQALVRWGWCSSATSSFSFGSMEMSVYKPFTLLPMLYSWLLYKLKKKTLF